MSAAVRASICFDNAESLNSTSRKSAKTARSAGACTRGLTLMTTRPTTADAGDVFHISVKSVIVNCSTGANGKGPK